VNKLFTFEDEPCIEIELELEFSYSYDPGRYHGKPEDCYPAEEESEITPPNDYESIIMAAYMAEAKQAVKRFEAKIEEMVADHVPRVWVEEYQEGL